MEFCGAVACGRHVALVLGCFLTVVGLPAAAPPRIKVVTSFLPLYCLATALAGEAAQVENLLPAGLSPHEYAFSPSDLRKLKDADLIIINGLGLESWLDKALQSVAGKTPASVVEAASGLSTELIPETLDSETEARPPVEKNLPKLSANPHIWLDPRLILHSMTNILRALQKADPARAGIFAANAAACATRLEKLDAELRAGLAPFAGVPILTQHRAFSYFARRYGLQIVGVLETTPEVEPSPRHLRELARLVREKKVKAIFTEALSPSKLARQFARDLNITSAELDTLETGPLTLTAYEDGMRKNLAALRRAMQGRNE
ncbi:MAG: zinc ABC transporter substrate-binding protein [Verrucomicrobia bacterium]|nr:zinc ABC transporter substrate-binding protein [Verrucomicrobiota bacterium]